MSDLRTVFGAMCTEEEIVHMMKEADIDGDNEISFAEFEEMMRMFVMDSIKSQARWSFSS